MFTLNNVMRANAVSCIVFGAIFLYAPVVVANFLSADMPAPKLALIVLGFGLVFNGSHLIWASFKLVPNKYLVLYFSIGDYTWVISTLCLILLGIWITSPKGILVAALISVMVGTFGLLQMTKRKRLEENK